jgi:hypothetical protein
MEKTIKFLLFTYGKEVDNPLYIKGGDQPETVLQEGLARLGETVDITRPYDLARGEELGAFFSDEDVKAIEEGTYRGPDAPAVAQARLAMAQTTIQPIEGEGASANIADMSTEEVAELIKNEKLNVNDTIALADENDVDSINKVLDAEVIATDSEPRVGVEKGLEAKLSAASANSPENDAE